MLEIAPIIAKVTSVVYMIRQRNKDLHSQTVACLSEGKIRPERVWGP